ncbi:MAG: class I SAM-dependent methyltransferase [Hyphomicrobiales bacterium]
MTASEKAFTGSVAALYESHMVPMLFAPYAADLAARVVAEHPAEVLEIAAGTGAITAELLARLPDAAITATDLNQAMLDIAAAKLASRRLRMRSCNAQELPFDDQSFDAVVCQFGAMFFPDKLTAYREARRVLRPGGTYFLSVWDDLESNPFAAVVHEMVANAFPDNPPEFFRRMPHGYHDVAVITATLASAGFGTVHSERLTLPCRAPSAQHVAVAMCQGTPLRPEIEQRAPGRLDEVTDKVATALGQSFGKGPVATTMRAILFEARA